MWRGGGGGWCVWRGGRGGGVCGGGGGGVVCVMEGGQRRVTELNEMEWEVECNIVTFTSQFSICDKLINQISQSIL